MAERKRKVQKSPEEMEADMRREEEFAREVAKVKASREKQDLKDLIALVLESPVNSSSANLAIVDGNYSISSLKDRNVDVRTRILAAMSVKAMAGDIKAAEFLMKYGGFEPPKEHNLDFRMPIIINDYTDDDSDDDGDGQ